MKEYDILGGWESKHTLTPPTYFQGVKTPNPQDLRPCMDFVAARDGGGGSGDNRNCKTR